jgi:hypothetical protein
MRNASPLYTHDGETLTLEEWSKRSGISVRALGQRMRFGRTLGEALTAKVQVKHSPRQTWREPANPVLTAWLRRPAP